MGILLVVIFGILICVVPVAIVILIIQAISKRNKDDKHGFDETIRNVYIYLILIITLVAIITGVITAFRVGLDVVLPEKSTTSYTTYNYSERERNNNIVELCTTLSIVITSIPIFVYHNKLAKKDKELKKQEHV